MKWITIINLLLTQSMFLCIQLGYKEIAVLLFIIIFVLLYYGLKKLQSIYFTFIEELIHIFYELLLVQMTHLIVPNRLFIQLVMISILDFIWIMRIVKK